MAFFFFSFFDDDDGRQRTGGRGGTASSAFGRIGVRDSLFFPEREEEEEEEEEGHILERKKNTTARVFRESLSLDVSKTREQYYSVCGREKTGLSLLRTNRVSKRERLKCMCTDEKRTCDTAFVCATKVLCSLSAENLPKKSVCVFRRRHSPTEEEEEEKEEEKEERRNARRKRAAAAFKWREEASSGRERCSL